MIGFDVNYGNPTFISHGENGYLIPIDKDDQDVEKSLQIIWLKKLFSILIMGLSIRMRNLIKLQNRLKLSILRKSGKI